MTISGLEFVNAFIGFCTPLGGTWPSPLAGLGYQAVGVETELTSEVDGRARRIVTDVVCASVALQHTLCVEAKSATLHLDQARGYLAMTSRNLVNMANLPPEIDPGILSHDVLFATSRQHEESLLRQLETEAIDLPLLAADETIMALVHGAIRQPQLDRVFRDGVKLPLQAWPRAFVPFTSSSSRSVMAPHVIRALVSLLRAGELFNDYQVCESSIPHWSLCGNTERTRLRRSVREILGLVEMEELNGYFRRLPPQSDRSEWEVRRPGLNHPNQLVKLQELATAFVSRTQQSLPFRRDQPLLIPPEAYDQE